MSLPTQKTQDEEQDELPRADSELSNEELGEVSGGRLITSDPCEGGQFHSN